MQYVDLCADADTKYSIKLQRDLLLLNARILKVASAVEYLLRDYDQELVDLLKDSGFRYAFNYDDREAYIKDLRLVLSSSKKWAIDLKLKQAEWEAYVNREQGKPPTREYFTGILIYLGQWMHYRINPVEVSVLEFAKMKQLYIKHHEQLDKQYRERLKNR